MPWESLVTFEVVESCLGFRNVLAAQLKNMFPFRRDFSTDPCHWGVHGLRKPSRKTGCCRYRSKKSTRGHRRSRQLSLA